MKKYYFFTIVILITPSLFAGWGDIIKDAIGEKLEKKIKEANYSCVYRPPVDLFFAKNFPYKSTGDSLSQAKTKAVEVCLADNWHEDEKEICRNNISNDEIMECDTGSLEKLMKKIGI